MENYIIEFYIEQYRKNAQKTKKSRVNTAHYMHKINAKAKSIARINYKKTEIGAANKLHNDVKKIVFLAYYTNNKNAKKIVTKEIIPNLVRIDMAFFNEEELGEITNDILHQMTKEFDCMICTKTLKEIYSEFRSRRIRKEIMNRVPDRPEMEFPDAMKMNRKFILHVGPTNSGKTYNALERLKTAKNGVYLGPLRLLALEVYEKMMDEGVPCTMLTGQECIDTKNSRVTASTVEMLDIDKEYDIAVIDEAQLVSDEIRGHSWTKAILGIKAEEIHICMSPVAKDVVIHLIGLCNDEYEINEYQRKTELVLENEPFSFPEDVKEKDAFIVFSKRSVLNIAARLEQHGIKASVIYGSLPPEIRRRQMSLFNSGQTKVVVSTDAIGMGLNLPVRRIVFLEIDKYDGKERRPLHLSEIKQIAGRAGRYGLYDFGYVNALGKSNLNYIKGMLNKNEQNIENVSLGFPQILLEMKEPLDEIIKLWHESKTPEPFRKINIDEILFLYREAFKDRYFIADFDDKYILYKMITCPVDIKDRELVQQWSRYCMSYTSDISLEHPDKRSRYDGLMRYESYYKKLDLYYQLSIRLGKIVDTEWLEDKRDYIQSKIMQTLSKNKNEYILRCRYCGRVLPIGVTYNICNECYRLKNYY